jgi:hypothetical protein
MTGMSYARRPTPPGIWPPSRWRVHSQPAAGQELALEGWSRSDRLVLLACFSLTVVFDRVVAVSVGIVLAARAPSGA